MGRITALLLGICAVLALGAPAARAGAWQFVQTSCQTPSGCLGVPLPQVLGTFSSPDQTRSYQVCNGFECGPTTESGDRNFTFHWPYAFTGAPINLPGFCDDCRFTIDWNGPPTILSYFQFYSSTNIDLGEPGNPDSVGSDGLIAGCNAFRPGSSGGVCIIGGFWDPVGVPEASSVTLLGVLLTLLALLRLPGMRARVSALIPTP